LRELFAKRGIAVGAGSLMAAMGTYAVEAAPTAFTLSICSSASITLVSSTAVVAKTIVMTTFQKSLVTAVLAVCVCTPLLIQHKAQTRLRTENVLLRAQLGQQEQLTADNQRLSQLLEQITATNSSDLPPAQFNELLRLRGEVTRLRARTRELAQSNAQLSAADAPLSNPLLTQLQQFPQKSIPELQFLDQKKWSEDAARAKIDSPDSLNEALAALRRAAKIRFAYNIAAALKDYAQSNNGQLPSDISSLKPYFKYAPDQQPIDDTVFQRYQLLHSGNLSDLPSGEPLLAEKGPVDSDYDTVFKIGLDGYAIQGTGKWSTQAPTTNKWGP
jgi:hypothetical protein